MWAIRSTAVLLLCLVITDIITHQSVQARFRGAQPKQIPSLAADGGLVNPNAGATVQRKDANVPKGVRRTKGGLLPWWVRKRLQEQTETKEVAADKKLYKSSRKKDKTQLKNVQIVQLARDDREEVSGGVDIGMVESGDSAIVVKDLPMEDGADQGADDRLAAFDSQMGILAENAKIEELSRGSGAEPDLLMDDAVKQAVQEHEDAAVKTGGQQLDQMEAAGSRQADSEEEAGEEPEIEGGQEQQGSLDYEEDEDEDSARRMLLQKPKKKRKRGRKARNPEDVPGSVSRSLPDEVLPAEQEEAAAAGLQWPEDPQQKDGGSGQDDNEDREIVMTDVSKAERQAEQLSAMADPGDSDNFEEGLLSAAADEDAASDAAVRSQNAAEIEQGDDRAKGGRGGKRTEPGKRRRRRKGTGQGPRRAAGRPARKRGGAKGAGAAAVAEGGEPRLRRRKGKGKGRKSRGHGTGTA